MNRVLTFAAVFVLLVLLLGRAIDNELASAGGLREGEPKAGLTTLSRQPLSTELASPSRNLHVSAKAAIRQVFGVRAPAAIRVVACETGGTFNARAVGRAGERGLFQIHPVHFSWAQPARLFDPVWNSRVAYRLSRGGTNWRPWSCRWAA